jgi:hypothetical protein
LERLGFLSSCTRVQKKYSRAFLEGDNKAFSNSLPEAIFAGSHKFRTRYEKKAYWRGVKNGKLRK